MDGRNDGGERSAGRGRCPSAPVPGFRRGRRGDEPPVGLSSTTDPLDQLDRTVCGEQQADQQDNRDNEQHTHLHLPSRRLRTVQTPSKAPADSIFQTVLVRVTRANKAFCLLRCSLWRPSAPGREGKWATRLNGPGGPKPHAPAHRPTPPPTAHPQTPSP